MLEGLPLGQLDLEQVGRLVDLRYVGEEGNSTVSFMVEDCGTNYALLRINEIER